MLYLMLHMMVHHNHYWRIQTGPVGWSAWVHQPNVQAVTGFIRGHFVSAWEVR